MSLGTTAAAEILISTVRDLAAVSALPQITRIVRHTARQLTEADGTTFIVREGDQCHYVDEEAIAPLWRGQHFPLASCISGWSMLYRQQVVIPDVYSDSRIPHEVYRRTFVRSLVMTPVRTYQPWAAIGVYWAEPHVPTAEQNGWLQALADSTAVAMESVRVQSELADHRAALFDQQHAQPARMCAWTKRFELDGEWVSIEEFLQRRFGVLVTHGVSEEALQAIERDVAGPNSPM